MVATNRGGLMVRKFCKINFLSTSQQSSMIEEISDIGKVEEGTVIVLKKAVAVTTSLEHFMMYVW